MQMIRARKHSRLRTLVDVGELTRLGAVKRLGGFLVPPVETKCQDVAFQAVDSVEYITSLGGYPVAIRNLVGSQGNCIVRRPVGAMVQCPAVAHNLHVGRWGPHL